jgi:hypothetical protein
MQKRNMISMSRFIQILHRKPVTPQGRPIKMLFCIASTTQVYQITKEATVQLAMPYIS